MTNEENIRRALRLSIECMNTINEGLVLHHRKRGCPEPSNTEYLEFLRNGSNASSRPKPKMLEKSPTENGLSIQQQMNPVHASVNQDKEEEVERNKVPNELHLPHPKIHTLFSTECNDYFDWQTLGLYHSFQLSGQPGFITRLLSCTEEKLATYKNIDLAPTHVVPSYSVHPLTGDR